MSENEKWGMYDVSSEDEEWSMWDVSSGVVDPTIWLIHPLSTEFRVAGSDEPNCQEWAVERKLMLVGGVANCAHGRYLMGCCPADCGDNIGLEHTSVWTQTDGQASAPFILTHPYVEEIPPEMTAYAAHHGLTVEVSEDDGWCGHGTLPIRFDMNPASTSAFAWPLQAKIAQLLTLYPPRWEGAGDIVDRARRTS